MFAAGVAPELLWRIALGLDAVPALLLLMLRVGLPETAIWLIQKGRFREAREVTRRFAYCATKGAVIAMTRQLSVDYVKDGIRSNAICPGTVYTPFVEGYVDRFHADTKEETIQELHARQPLGRMGRPEEVADLAVYLATDEAGFMTGSAVVLDGGWTAQ